MLVFDNVSYDGQGGGIALGMNGLVNSDIRNSRFSSCGVGIDVATDNIDPPFGNHQVVDSTFEGCDVGMRFHFTFFPQERLITWPTATIENSEFIDVGTGITAAADLTVSNTTFADNEATEAPSRTGIGITEGALTATDVTITGHDLFGIAASGASSEQSLYVDLSGMLVEGGQQGIDFSGPLDSGSLMLRSSIVRDQTVSAVSVGSFELFSIDLNGDNRLSVTGGFALDDRRTENGRDVAVEADGITLNGNSYSGRIDGPVEVPPDYRIVSAGTIQF